MPTGEMPCAARSGPVTRALATDVGGGRRPAVAERWRVPPVLIDIETRARRAPPEDVDNRCRVTSKKPVGLVDGPPPLARGERDPGCAGVEVGRTTPACAGRTAVVVSVSIRAPDHPRLRGENGQRPRCCCITAGPPPPARGEPSLALTAGAAGRTTPACAGRTQTRWVTGCPSTDHPRLRGEHPDLASVWTVAIGPPPLARGALHRGTVVLALCRSTPARAGSTPPGRNAPTSWTVHPRSRGEHDQVRFGGFPARGPPPLARGALLRAGEVLAEGRSTPARAGSTRVPGP